MATEKYHKLGFIVMLILMSACIKNDIPYPIIHGEFLSFQVENQLGESLIDKNNKTILIELAEEVNPAQTKVISYTITEDATISPDITDVINLSDSLVYTISTYQDYVWTIKASQSFERYFRIDDQVGNQIIDVEKHYAKASVFRSNDLSNINVVGLKLGPPEATYDPEPSSIKDFTNDVAITVSYRGITENWTLSVVHGDGNPDQNEAEILAFTLNEQMPGNESLIVSHTIDEIDGFIDMNVTGSDLSGLSIQNIKLSEGATCELASDDIINLSEPKEIVVTAGSGKTKKWLIRAHPAVELNNRLFTNWHLNGKVWNPYLSSEARYWCTGNEGVVTLADSNTRPITVDNNNQGARLETISLGFLGSIAGTPIAAGNLFIGNFVLNINNPAQSVKFGRAFNGRPNEMSCAFSYKPAINEEVVNGIPIGKGDMDIGHIWLKVLHVDNDTGEFDPDTHLPVNAVIIGEGELVIDTEYPDIVNKTFDINYHLDHLDKMPTHMAIIATSSYYGEFFVGGVGSLLLIEEFNLIY